MPSQATITTAATLLISGLLYVVVVTYRHRARINALRNLGLPMPEGWSWLFGHSLILLKYKSRFPPLANIGYATTEISKQFPDTEMFLLDLWPGYFQNLIVCNVEAANYASINMPKPPNSAESVRPIVGGEMILSMNGAEWKFWRSLLSPGFSTQSMMAHVPFIVSCAEVFCEKLREKAGKGVFLLDEFATKLTFDVIMKVTLDADINYQREEHILPTAINTITAWHSFWDIRVLMNPLRPIVQGYYGRKLEKYVGDEIQRRFEELKTRDRESSESAKPKRAQSVVSLALEGYLADPKSKSNNASNMVTLDPAFAKLVSNHIRLFLLAGNDTTSSTIVFALHMLSTHAAALAKMQAEHDAVFGRDPANTAALLKATPTLLNQCRYTLAFVKETLRLYPPAANQRLGSADVALPGLDGKLFPTKDLNIIIMHQPIHWNPRIWVKPMEFLPERWLVDSGHELYPPEGAFKAFDVGPRRCIGQELSLTEIKTVLVLTARNFVFKTAYEEWDEIKESKRGVWERMLGGLGKAEEIKTVDGSRVFQSDGAGNHPSEGYPCRVEVFSERR